ncbi:hypothetical protein [Nostoc sp. CHAB 5715]|uniref:hypothetical protein n=1 Tax=Nostoc sp. CHAB 5715 TaxID=2780400 RepID=UPI001E4A00A0|nr:hypothetical protein [Nostoc sp. CHAB 5715]MCC5621842.1 hypothetical protein [Nostoc sp. CHAB 5715]
MRGFDEISLKIFKEAMPSLPNAPLPLIALSSQVVVNLCGCDRKGGWKEEGFSLVHQSLRYFGLMVLTYLIFII